MAAYEVSPAPVEGDPYPVFQVLRLDLVPPAGSGRKAPPDACRYYQVIFDERKGELLVKRLARLDAPRRHRSETAAAREVPVVRLVHARHGELRCSCGRGGECPHRAIWEALHVAG